VSWTGAPSTLNCNYSGSILLITNAFPSDLSSQYTYFSLRVSNIQNPFPAGTTSSFVVAFLFPNSTNQTSINSPTVTITEGQAICSKSILNGLVSAIGVITVNFTPKNIINNGSTVSLAVTMNRSYPNDTTNTDVTPSSSGSTVTGTYRFNFTLVSSFNITMLMPPSTQPVSNFIRVVSYIVGGNVDSCYLSIDGITTNNFTAATISTGRVQTTASLSINFINLSPIYLTDQLVVTFPSDFNLTGIGSIVTFVRGTTGSRIITVLNNIVTIANVATATLIHTNTTFVLSNIILPFSIKALQVTLTSQTITGYQKDSSVLTFVAQMGSLSGLSITCGTSQLGYNSTCTFSLTLQSSLSNTSYITFSFTSDVALAGANYQCLTTGTDTIRSNCTNFFNNNSISVSGLTSTTIAAGTIVTVNVSLPLPTTPGNYTVNVSTWSSALIDTGAATLTITQRQLLSTEFTAVMGSQTTYTASTYLFTLQIPIAISASLTALINIPVDTQGVLSCNGGAILSSFTTPILTLQLPSVAAGGTLTLNVSGLLTPISTQPIFLSGQLVSTINNSLVYFSISSLTLQATNPRNFLYIASSQTSTIVNSNTTLTIILSGLNATTNIQMQGTTFNGNCIALSNLTNISCNSITNGVQLIVNTDGANSSDTRRYSFSVDVITPGFVGSQAIAVTAYTASGLYIM
jgi:hypothetical protein